MTAHKQYYLTCDHCGKIYLDEGGETSFGEESECVKGAANDDGWFCDVEDKDGNMLDFCDSVCKDCAC